MESPFSWLDTGACTISPLQRLPCFVCPRAPAGPMPPVEGRVGGAQPPSYPRHWSSASKRSSQTGGVGPLSNGGFWALGRPLAGYIPRWGI